MKWYLAFTLPLLGLAATACGGRGAGDPTSTVSAEASPAAESATGSAGTPTPVATTRRVAVGISHGSLEFEGQRRTYRLFIPSGTSGGQKLPLVVGLHGGLGSGDQFAENSRFEKLAETEKFVAVFPDGIGRTWNGGNCCGGAVRQDIDDTGFLAALIERLASELPVDRGRVFMAGHSNGGMMAFRFGCEQPELVLGVAPVAGSLELPLCESDGKTNLLAIHGDADQSHPIEGGSGPRSIAGVDFVSMADSMAHWTRAKGCGPERVSPGDPVTTHAWDCPDGTVARLLVVAGADHPWPGGVGGRTSAQERTSGAMDATEVAWEFFKNLRSR